MAIVGKHNVIELLRIQKTPYWRLYENSNKRLSGNFIDSADFTDPTLDIAISAEGLRRSLDMLSTGVYVLTAYTSKDKSKGGIDTLIEIEGRSGGSSSAISGIGTTPEFYMEGIGRVTSDNFEAAIDAKIEKVRQEDKKAAEEAAIKRELAELKKQLSDNESGFQRGVISIGSVLYDVMKDTESGKKVMGLASKVYMATRDTTTVAGTNTGVTPSGDGGSGLSEQDRADAALERLATNNPDFVGQLEKLANLKETDPSTFEMAVSSLG
jgi:hypothetical protein